MTPGYGDSYTVWCSPTPGTTVWPFLFVDGYIDQAFVKARYRDDQNIWWPIKVLPENFITADQLRLDVPPATMVEIYRDTPKDHPLVVWGRGGMQLAAESRNAAVRQALHVIVELKDLAHRSDLQCLCDCLEGTP